jgi:CHASE2 domain-containing sensor protein
MEKNTGDMPYITTSQTFRNKNSYQTFNGGKLITVIGLIGIFGIITLYLLKKVDTISLTCVIIASVMAIVCGSYLVFSNQPIEDKKDNRAID